VAIYCRISKDEAGDELGVKRQEADCRQLARAKGYRVVRVFTDDDLSAYDGRRRPAYERLLAGLGDEEFDVVMAWKLDRLTRSGIRGLTALLEALDAAGASLVCVHDQIDTTSAMGEGVAGLIASMAKAESENLSLRSRRKKDELAAKGLPAGFCRAFGYRDNGMSLDEAEARLLRDAARRVLAGESVTAIVKEWNERGLRTPRRGALWSATVLRRVLTNPRAAGLRVHRGEVVGDAAWPAILDRGTHERLVAHFNDPARRLKNPPRRALLTGLVKCGRCGGAMFRDGTKEYPTFRCRSQPGSPACAVTVAARHVETLVTEAVLLRLDGPGLAKALRAHPSECEDIAAIDLSRAESRLTELAETWAAGAISRSEWLAARQALERQVETARRELARTNDAEALEPYANDAGALRAAWPHLSRDQRRAVFGAVVDRVVISPAGENRRRFDPSRVDVTWKM
jgi:DNA invertase Pin-like site-specific DNA recombinase